MLSRSKGRQSFEIKIYAEQSKAELFWNLQKEICFDIDKYSQKYFAVSQKANFPFPENIGIKFPVLRFSWAVTTLVYFMFLYPWPSIGLGITSHPDT